MTANQVSYARYMEDKRHNQVSEVETERSNRTREKETERSNRAREKETYRSNIANETETRRHNVVNETETMRANQAREAETYRSNVARETETHRTNVANESIKWSELAEKQRTNKANEAIKQEQNDLKHDEVLLKVNEAVGDIDQWSTLYNTNLEDQLKTVDPYLEGAVGGPYTQKDPVLSIPAMLALAVTNVAETVGKIFK